jgi:hypothetical protein
LVAKVQNCIFSSRFVQTFEPFHKVILPAPFWSGRKRSCERFLEKFERITCVLADMLFCPSPHTKAEQCINIKHTIVLGTQTPIYLCVSRTIFIHIMKRSALQTTPPSPVNGHPHPRRAYLNNTRGRGFYGRECCPHIWVKAFHLIGGLKSSPSTCTRGAPEEDFQ